MTTLRNELIKRAQAKTETQGKYVPLKRDDFARTETENFTWSDYNFTCFQALEAKNRGGDMEIELSPLFKALDLDKNNDDDKIIIDAIVNTPIATTRNGQAMTDETKAARKAARETAKANDVEFKDVYTETDTFKPSVVQTLSVESYRKTLESVIAMILNNQADIVLNANNAKNEKIIQSMNKNIEKYEKRYSDIVSEQPCLAREFDHSIYNVLKENVKQMYEELIVMRMKNSSKQEETQEETDK